MYLNKVEGKFQGAWKIDVVGIITLGFTPDQK